MNYEAGVRHALYIQSIEIHYCGECLCCSISQRFHSQCALLWGVAEVCHMVIDEGFRLNPVQLEDNGELRLRTILLGVFLLCYREYCESA